MQVIYKPKECCGTFSPLTIFIWVEISDSKYIEFLCHKKMGIFRHVWQCPCYKTKPSGLFKYQLIQHFCGFLVINVFQDSIIFHFWILHLFHSLSSLIYRFKKTCFIPTACALDSFHYFTIQTPRKGVFIFNSSVYFLQRKSSFHVYQ